MFTVGTSAPGGFSPVPKHMLSSQPSFVLLLFLLLLSLILSSHVLEPLHVLSELTEISERSAFSHFTAKTEAEKG